MNIEIYCFTLMRHIQRLPYRHTNTNSKLNNLVKDRITDFKVLGNTAVYEHIVKNSVALKFVIHT